MHLALTWLLLGFAILKPSATPLPILITPSSGPVINEFLAGPAHDWDGSGTFSSRDDEWIEIYNVGPDPADLSAYLLTDGDRIPRCVPGGTLAPGAVRIVYGKESYDWEKAHGYPAYGLSLSNTSDTVMLWKIVGTDTTLVDSYAYLSHEAASDRAVGRHPDGGQWSLFDGLNPYTGTTPPLGSGCAPSPGVVNLCGDTPAKPTTWSRVKTIYH